MTDREMLELAAKAAGIDGLHLGSQGIQWWIGETGRTWNPLADDGDALRLAVMLGILSMHKKLDALIREYQKRYLRPEATRCAIVHIAAEIGAQL